MCHVVLFVSRVTAYVMCYCLCHVLLRVSRVTARVTCYCVCHVLLSDHVIMLVLVISGDE